MKAMLLGPSIWRDVRFRTLRAAGWIVEDDGGVAPDDAGTAAVPAGIAPVVFVAGGGAAAASAAEQYVRAGSHVFLEPSGSLSNRDCERLMRVGREAGVEIGISRPLRFHAALSTCAPKSFPCVLSVWSRSSEGAASSWRGRLVDLLDLCGTLCGTFSVKRVDASATRTEDHRPAFLAVTIRFVNGSFAQVTHRSGSSDSAIRLALASNADIHDLSVSIDEQSVADETRAFASAIAGGGPIPVSVADALLAGRMAEQVIERMR